MLKSESCALKIQQAKLLQSLDQHEGWRIIADKIQLMVDGEKSAILDQSLDHEATQRKRCRIEILQWVLDAPGLNNEKQIRKWEADMTFHRKNEKMRDDAGLPKSRQEMMDL